MLRFWEMLTEGVVAGRQLLGILRSIQQALPAEPMGHVAASLADDITRGVPLSEAMKKRPAVFTKAHVSFIECGQYVGRLDRLLPLLLELTRECPTCGNLKFPT
jgi:type II secretory pathway component PulF